MVIAAAPFIRSRRPTPRPRDARRFADGVAAPFVRAVVLALCALLGAGAATPAAAAADANVRPRAQDIETKPQLIGSNVEVRTGDESRTVLEMQKNFEAERRIRMIEQKHRQSQEQIWWLLAAVFAIAFFIVTVLYRAVRRTNRLLAQKNAELGLQSSRDPLTALYNRRHFQNFVNDIPNRTDRRGAVEEPMQAILLIDLDHFKLINDRFGHAVGDAALIAVARRLRDALRETDMIVRWGGEEFLVYVPVVPAGRLDEIVARVMHGVSATPVNVMGKELHVAVSIGYSPLLLPPDNIALGWERVLGLADKALYMAKSHGRNRAYGVVGLRGGGADALAAIEADLEQAWRNGLVTLREVQGDDLPVIAAVQVSPADQAMACGEPAHP